MLKVQKWRRLGLVCAPQNLGPWGIGYTAVPTVLALQDDIIRVFFSVRDQQNRSSLASVDVALTDHRFQLVSAIRGPLLTPGTRGAFDADGVNVSCIIRDGGRLRGYYLGWTTGTNVPYTNFIGLAEANSSGPHFERRYRAPIIGRSEINPFSLAYPWVVRCDDSWRMWFGSVTWGQHGLDYRVVIKAARSLDGDTWEQQPDIVIPLLGNEDSAEYAVSRPVVVRESGYWSMWYARRNPDYRLGYAYSDDGESWIRRDDLVALDGPAGSWEAAMQTYPCVFDHNGRRYMLYNGDGFGRTGFGLAVLDN